MVGSGIDCLGRLKMKKCIHGLAECASGAAGELLRCKGGADAVGHFAGT